MKVNNMKSQKTLVKEYLLKGKVLTSRKAIIYWNVIRLSAIIFNLREDGLNIITERQINYTGKGTYAEYSIKNK